MALELPRFETPLSGCLWQAAGAQQAGCHGVTVWKCPEVLVPAITCSVRDFTSARWSTSVLENIIYKAREDCYNGRKGSAELKNKR